MNWNMRSPAGDAAGDVHLSDGEPGQSPVGNGSRRGAVMWAIATRRRHMVAGAPGQATLNALMVGQSAGNTVVLVAVHQSRSRA